MDLCRVDDDFIDPHLPPTWLGARVCSTPIGPAMSSCAMARHRVADDRPSTPTCRDHQYYLGEDASCNIEISVREPAHSRAGQLDKLRSRRSTRRGLRHAGRRTRRRKQAFAALKADPITTSPSHDSASTPLLIDGGRAAPRGPAPFILSGEDRRDAGRSPCGVAAGSFVVNSSQGGGSKDTWILARREGAPDDARAGGGQPHWIGCYLSAPSIFAFRCDAQRDLDWSDAAPDRHIALRGRRPDGPAARPMKPLALVLDRRTTCDLLSLARRTRDRCATRSPPRPGSG
jgi:hypothetical protein